MMGAEEKIKELKQTGLASSRVGSFVKISV